MTALSATNTGAGSAGSSGSAPPRASAAPSAAHSTIWWHDRSIQITLGLMVVALAALFFRWGMKQSQFAVNNFEDWGHTFFIPVIAGYLVWKVVKPLSIASPRIFWPAMAPFLLGITSYFYFVVAVPNHMLQGLAIVLTIASLALWVLGTEIFRYLFLPIAYLFFAIRLSQKVMTDLTFELQIMATKGGEIVLTVVGTLMGFDVEREGNILNVTSAAGVIHPLNVAEACAGMRMVVAFFALAAVVALAGCRHWWQRVVLLMLAAPVAVLLNIARVSVLGLLTLADADLASGEAHTLIGTLLLIPGLGLFLLIVWALKRTIVDEPVKAETAA